MDEKSPRKMSVKGERERRTKTIDRVRAGLSQRETLETTPATALRPLGCVMGGRERKEGKQPRKRGVDWCIYSGRGGGQRKGVCLGNTPRNRRAGAAHGTTHGTRRTLTPGPPSALGSSLDDAS